MSRSIEERLDQLEQRLDRIVSLLERGGAPHRSDASSHVVAGAVESAESSLAASTPNLGATLADALVRLGDAETLESIGRIATLLPQLEYAVQGVAAGPELLEEGIATMKERLARAGLDDHEIARRTEAAVNALLALSKPAILSAASRLGSALPDAEPLVGGVADASSALASVEGGDRLRGRVRDAVLSIADPQTLEALARIAALAPDLEMAVQGVAAAPTLLDEGLEVAREALRARGLDAHELSRRLAAAGDALAAASAIDVTSGVGRIAATIPALSPPVVAIGEAARELAAVEGSEALAGRLREAVLSLAAPEVLESLVRVASLLPDLEYAVQAVAAGPVLLEEALEVARKFATEHGAGPEIDARLRAVAGLFVSLSEPSALAALRGALAMLPKLEAFTKVDPAPILSLVEIAGKKETVKGLERLLGLATKADTLTGLERLLALTTKKDLLASVERLLALATNGETLASLERLLSLATKGETVASLERALPLLTKPETIAAVETILPLIAKSENVDALAGILEVASDLDTEALAKLLAAASRPEAVRAVERILERTGDVERILEALPSQATTLDVLRGLNAAVADSVEGSHRMGFFGLLGALREDDVQRAAGFGVAVARSFGRSLDGRESPKRLSAKK